MTRAVSWVLGAGGLLGQHTVSALRSVDEVWSPRQPILWNAPDAAGQVVAAVHEFDRAVGARPWSVLWCAGAGVTGTSVERLQEERVVFDAMLAAVGDSGLVQDAGRGALFLASSAGGVYAGSSGAPFRESSPTRALSPYGETKLHLEASVRVWSAQSGVPVLVGRIANLYGPGQDLAKSQGLISQVARAHLRGQPTSIYVSLDTVRDYLFAPDCAALVSDGIGRLRAETRRSGAAVHVKVLASQQGVTIGAVISELKRVLKRTPRIVHGASPVARYQVRDLRLRSDVWPELDRRSMTPLPAGIKTTVIDLLQQLQAGRL